MPMNRNICLFWVLSLGYLVGPAFGASKQERACFWGTLKATYQLAGKLCPDLVLGAAYRDNFEIYDKERTFVRCHHKRRDQLLATRARVKADIDAWCTETQALKGFAEEPLFEKRRVVTSLDRDSTIDDWKYATKDAQLQFVDKVAPIISRDMGGTNTEAAIKLLKCLEGFTRDGEGSAVANETLNRISKLTDITALCGVMQ